MPGDLGTRRCQDDYSVFASLHLSSPPMQTSYLHWADSSPGPYLQLYHQRGPEILSLALVWNIPGKSPDWPSLNQVPLLEKSTGVKGLEYYGFWPRLQIQDLREEKEQCPKWDGLYPRRREGFWQTNDRCISITIFMLAKALSLHDMKKKSPLRFS